MEIKGKNVLVCDCEGTMPLDAGALGKACGTDAPTIHTQLCRSQLGEFQRAILGDQPVVVACTQEAPLFGEVQQDSNPEASLSFTNIRERAGWSDEAKNATAKIAALLAESALDFLPTGMASMESKGVTLVYGRDETALEAAKQLAGRVAVTVVLSRPEEVLPPRTMDVAIFRGTITEARGYLGAVEVTIDDHADLVPSSRDRLTFGEPSNGVAVTCDMILDLTGGPPLFPAPEKRDGYFNPDPGNPAQVQRALFDIADMVGTFDKPIYVDYTADICAHARSGQVGCTRCLDVCPASAIEPDGDHVKIDPHICAGCGLCASVCPTGAARYALPAGDAIYQRLRTMLGAYLGAGGKAPVLLVHDVRHGEEMINLIARCGRGLPARVLPFALNEATQVGFDFFAAALAYGATQVNVLVAPGSREHLDALAGQVELAESAMTGLGYGAGRVAVIDEVDPDAVEALLYDGAALEPPTPSDFLPMGDKRAVTMLALKHLHAHAPAPVDIVPLASGAPFGTVEVDVKGCTLCLACVGACPTGALVDNPDQPMVRFQEEACVQCGLCRATCPESVITLAPRFNFASDARDAIVLNEEEPFACVRCDKPFGVRSTIERMVEKLAGHSMFADDPGAIERIRMCDDCRVAVQFEVVHPFASRPRPTPRTTEDDLREREQQKAREMYDDVQDKAPANGSGKVDDDNA